MEKWFLRSRRLLAAAVPLLVVLGEWGEFDGGALGNMLGALLDNFELTAQQGILLGSGLAGLYTFAKPDDAQLRALPKPVRDALGLQ